jgi:SAM-dependent methyltransferase
MVERGQVVTSAAVVYEEFFLPALFQQWTSQVADTARIQPGDRVLDVACGTGVLARAVHERVGPSGSVIGLDVNENMLSVAKSKAPEVEWRKANAEKLPFDADAFDAVVSQFGLMFFEDPLTALREMRRVLRPGGNLSVAVWGALKDSPGYAAMTELLRRLFGDEAAAALEAPFGLGDKSILSRLFADAGMTDADIITQEGRAHFPSLQAWTYTEIKGWTLAEVLDDEQYQLLLQEAEQELKPFVSDDGSVSFVIPAHIVKWRKAD